MRPTFIAIDGESFGHEITGEEIYFLMANSKGETIYEPSGISTTQALDFICDCKVANRKSVFVAFGLNYDVNMILRDVPQEKLTELWTTTKVMIGKEPNRYHLEWIPSKRLIISREKDDSRVDVQDVFGFFQASFVKSLEAWNIPDPSGFIAHMKAERGKFKLRDLSEIKRYCIGECDLLVTLCDKLAESLDEAGLMPRSWIGAGSVAAALLRKQKIHEAKPSEREYPDALQEASYCAYFGGRVEIFMQGVMSNVVNYDIRSAYPAEAMGLPDLHGEWKRVSSYDPSARFALWLVEWDVGAEALLTPFPWRFKKEIYYPTNGKGWYHAKEVRTAIAVFGETIQVRQGYVFKPDSDARPFAFIREVYETRNEAKKAGLASEKALKLGLNAMYGKLAQGDYGRRIPPFRSYLWAGAITAGTRAKMLDIASLNPSTVISIATDGVMFSGDPRVEESEYLGGWERSEYQELFVAQAGIYWAMKNGAEVQRSRGFFLKEIDFPDLKEGWLETGPYYVQESDSHRFHGLGSCILHGDLTKWRRWIDGKRHLKLYPSRKFYAHDENPSRVKRLLPPTLDPVTLSGPYVPKGRGIEISPELEDNVMGQEQPMKEF